MTYTFRDTASPRKLSAEEAGGGGAPDYIGKLMEGFQLGMTPRRMADELLKNKLLNQIQQSKAKYAEQQEQAELGKKQAMTEHYNAQKGLAEARTGAVPYDIAYKQALGQRAQQLANRPILAGDAKEAYALEDIRRREGENSKVYQDAKKAYELTQFSKKQLNDYRQSLQESMGKRASTGLGKMQQELVEIRSGYLPGSNGSIKLSPQQQEALEGQYELAITKQSSDVDTRKKAAFASNIDKTLNAINVDDLVQFGGLQGGINKKVEEGKALTGNETKSYRNYQKALTGAKTLAKQVRQFYGDSITPQVQEQLAALTNPANWINNPRIAKNNFLAFKNILESETKTYTNLLKNVNEFNKKEENTKYTQEQINAAQAELARRRGAQ